MANFEKLARAKNGEDAQVTASDPIAEERKKRAERYLSKGAGALQGDQIGDSAKRMRAEAAKLERKGTQIGRTKAQDLRNQADQLEGD